MPAADAGPRLVDTSVWIRADRKANKALKNRLAELTVAGVAWICWPIRAELLIGVKSQEKWAELDGELAALTHAPVTDDSWRRAALLGHTLARKGNTVPLADLLIAVCAMDHNLPLWTADSDFKRIALVAPLKLDWLGADSSP